MKKLAFRLAGTIALWVFILTGIKAEVKPGLGIMPKGKRHINDFRFGGGVGYGLYINNQLDYAITTNYGPFNELQTNYTFGIFKVLNQNFEAGVHYRIGHLLTLKSENTLGAACDFDEVQFQVNYSLNHNVSLDGGPFTLNVQAGLGANYFRAMFFGVSPETKTMTNLVSTVGYGNTGLAARFEPDKVTTLIGNLGFVVGFRLSPSFLLYWENSLNMSVSNKMSGNLFKRSWLPPDNYFYTGIGLFLRFGNSSNKLSCPKF